MRCSFETSSTSSELPGPKEHLRTLSQESTRPRGRGRPRKDWSVVRNVYPPSLSTTPEATTVICADTSLNIEEAELLLHFTQHTAYSLAEEEGTAPNPMLRFWSYNLPRIGLTDHYVLHLAYRLAANHIAYLEKVDISRKLKYREIAQRHASLGLPQLTQALATLDKDNCGAVYAAATLMCYCTFAAGPTGPGDLLVCNVEMTHDVAWLPLIYGVRLIREGFDEDELFTGLMEPFHSKSHEKKTQPGEAEGKEEARKPRFVREGFRRRDWHAPLRKLRDFVVAQPPENDGCLCALDCMLGIYEASYGDEDGFYDGPSVNQFVFGWLYRLDRRFINRLQRKDPIALVILAYYAVLISTMERLWYMTSWADHLVGAVKSFIHEDYIHWLEWPADSLEHRGQPILTAQ